MNDIDLEKIRTTVIVSICSDDYLFDRLVLKGGNALRLLHGIGLRTSIDIDFSMESDFEDVKDAEKRLYIALHKNFFFINLFVFDYKFYAKPKAAENEWWGGYCVEFKLIDSDKAEEEDINKMRREALGVVAGGKSSRKFTIDISKHEFVDAKQESEIDGYLCYVYTPSMIAAEKLRAICQQMPEYEFVKVQKRRARDFYDLYAILEQTKVDFSSSNFKEILEKVFEAKKVPIELLKEIPSKEIKEYHQNDWISVRDTIEDKSKDFDFYYNELCKNLEKIKL